MSRPPSMSPFSDHSNHVAGAENASSKKECSQGYWSEIIPRGGSNVPYPRSMHVGAIWRSKLYVFGGYNGRQRSNDLHVYDFPTNCWTQCVVDGIVPPRRDRHTAVVYMNSLVVFGGYNGIVRGNGETTIGSLLIIQHLPYDVCSILHRMRSSLLKFYHIITPFHLLSKREWQGDYVLGRVSSIF